MEAVTNKWGGNKGGCRKRMGQGYVMIVADVGAKEEEAVATSGTNKYGRSSYNNDKQATMFVCVVNEDGESSCVPCAAAGGCKITAAVAADC